MKSEIFPKWKYHKEHEARIFLSAESLTMAGNGWVDSPADFDEKEDAPIEEIEEIEEIEDAIDFSMETNKALISKLVNEYGVNIKEVEKLTKAKLIDRLELEIEELNE